MAAQEARYGSDYDRQVAEDNCDPPTKITSNLHLIYFPKKCFFDALGLMLLTELVTN